MLIVDSSFAAKVYKCTNDKGKVTYQSDKCKKSQGKAKELNIFVPPVSQNPFSYYPVQQNNLNDGVDRIVRDHNKTRRQIRNSYDKALRRMDNQNCQLYRDYLSEAKEEWKLKRRRGYKTWEEDYHKQQIRNAQRDVKRECN